MNANKNHSQLSWDCYNKPCTDQQPSSSPRRQAASVADVGDDKDVTTQSSVETSQAVCDQQGIVPQAVCMSFIIYIKTVTILFSVV